MQNKKLNEKTCKRSVPTEYLLSCENCGCSWRGCNQANCSRVTQSQPHCLWEWHMRRCLAEKGISAFLSSGEKTLSPIFRWVGEPYLPCFVLAFHFECTVWIKLNAAMFLAYPCLCLALPITQRLKRFHAWKTHQQVMWVSVHCPLYSVVGCGHESLYLTNKIPLGEWTSFTADDYYSVAADCGASLKAVMGY